jgi:hypothetical protein
MEGERPQAEREDMSKQKIRTVTRIYRQKWHRDTDKWQVKDDYGYLYSCYERPFPSKVILGSWDCYNGDWNIGPTRKKDDDYRTTLRRIVDRKPKRKTVEDD